MKTREIDAAEMILAAAANFSQVSDTSELKISWAGPGDVMWPSNIPDGVPLSFHDGNVQAFISNGRPIAFFYGFSSRRGYIYILPNHGVEEIDLEKSTLKMARKNLFLFEVSD